MNILLILFIHSARLLLFQAPDTSWYSFTIKEYKNTH